MRRSCRTNTKVCLAAILMICAGWKADAQQKATTVQEAAAPPQGFFGRPGPKSPEFGLGGSITFRLMAPSASTVKLSGDWQAQGEEPFTMTKGEGGLWELSVSGLKPELCTYTFVVDGVRMLDPGNANVMRDGTRFLSALMIPGKGSVLYETTTVPHGTLHEVWYPSPALGMAERRMVVFTPVGYEDNALRYPVLYLLHGGGGDEESWDTMGRANEILDNMIAMGKALPMIMVMTNGNWNQTASPGITKQASQSIPNAGSPAGAAALGIAQMKFTPSLVSDVIPFVDKHYRTIADRDHRAIAGLSMGGAQSAFVGLNHLDQFSYVAMFSAGFPLLPGALKVVPIPVGIKLRGPGLGQELNLTEVAKDFPELNADSNTKLHLLYISCGKDDGLITANQQFMEWLTSKGVIYRAMLLPDYSHEWPFWRLSLADLIPKLFK